MKIPTNTILNVDCVEGMQHLPDECIPFTLTSPPYDNLRKFGGHPFEFEKIAEQLFRITTQGGVVVWVVQDQISDGSESGTSSRQKLFFKDLGFRLHNTLIMEKAWNRSEEKVRYGTSPEFAFVLSKGKPRTINLIKDKPNTTAGRKVRGNFRLPDGSSKTKNWDRRVRPFGARGGIWRYVGRASMDNIGSKHPGIMHEDAAQDHIQSWSNPGDIVFDPMAGGATTLKMALLNHRRYLGMEIHVPYYELAQERMKLAHSEYLQRLDEFLSAIPAIAA